MKWAVSYSATMYGPYEWVADEDCASYAELRNLLLGAYTIEETPAGFYRLRPEFGGAEYLLHKTQQDIEWQRIEEAFDAV